LGKDRGHASFKVSPTSKGEVGRCRRGVFAHVLRKGNKTDAVFDLVTQRRPKGEPRTVDRARRRAYQRELKDTIPRRKKGRRGGGPPKGGKLWNASRGWGRIGGNMPEKAGHFSWCASRQQEVGEGEKDVSRKITG